MNRNDFEHVKPDRPRLSWLVLLVFTLVILASGLAIHHQIPDAPRRWNFGALPDVPGESAYSPRAPRPAVVPRQIEPLPGAVTNAPPRTRTEDRP